MRLLLLALTLVALAAAQAPVGYPPLDGVGNNQNNPYWGAAFTPFFRMVHPPGPELGSDEEAALPPPRNISNALCGLVPSFLASNGYSQWFNVWGQLVAHDLSDILRNFSAPAPMSVPTCDPVLDPHCTGTATMPFYRALLANPTAPAGSTPEPMSRTTSFLDASTLYSVNATRLGLLRAGSGGAMTLTPDSALAPFYAGAYCGMEMDATPIAASRCPMTSMQAAGDERANINPAMLALLTVLLREHNARAAAVVAANASATDEWAFQEARKWVIGIVQYISLYEYLPLLIGSGVGQYSSYNPELNPGVDLFFATASFRYGHSSIPTVVPRLDSNWQVSDCGPLLMRDMMYDATVLEGESFEEILRGLASVPEDEVDTRMVADVRDYLTQQRDLAAVDLQRARDVALPTYQSARRYFGLPSYTNISQITTNEDVVAGLIELYGDDIERIDGWIGGLAEDHLPGAAVGPLFAASISNAFTRLRLGDAYWFEIPGYFDPEDLAAIQATTLSALLQRNSNVGFLPPEVFFATPDGNLTNSASSGASSGASTATGGSGGNGQAQFSINALPGYKIGWTVDSARGMINFTLSNQGPTGFMGVGFGTNMIKVPVMIASVHPNGATNGTYQVGDFYSADFNPEPFTSGSDIVPGTVVGAVVGGTTTISFSRTLTSTATHGFSIAPGLTNIIFARNPDEPYGYHGPSNRGTAQVDFYSGDSDIVTSDSFATQTFHGVLMFTLWGVIYPLGIWIVRYRKHTTWWLNWHIRLQTTGILGAMGSMGIALVSRTSMTAPIRVAHGIVGLSLIGALLVQSILGYYNSYSLSNAAPAQTRLRTLVRWAHHLIGIGLVVGAPINMYLGIRQLLQGTVPAVLLSMLLGYYILLLAAFFYAEGTRAYQRRHVDDDDRDRDQMVKQKRGNSTLSLATITWPEIRAHTRAGAVWVVVDGLVCDCREWMEYHPGGKKLIQVSVGKDITGKFKGREEDTTVRSHRHSQNAYATMASLAVFRLAELPSAEGVDVELEARQPGDETPANNTNASIFSSMRWGNGPQAPAVREPRDSEYATWVVERIDTAACDATYPVKLLHLRVAEESATIGPDGGPPPLPVAGQAVRVRVTARGQTTSRCYTPVPPRGGFVSGRMDLAVKVYPRGKVSGALGRLKVGETLVASFPFGHSTLQPNAAHGCWGRVLMVAAGSGLTPMLQLIEHHDAAYRRMGLASDLTLIYCNSRVDDIILRPRLNEYARNGVLRYIEVLTDPPQGTGAADWNGITGRINATIIANALKPYQSATAAAYASVYRTLPRPSSANDAFEDSDSLLPGGGGSGNINHEASERTPLTRPLSPPAGAPPMSATVHASISSESSRTKSLLPSLRTPRKDAVLTPETPTKVGVDLDRVFVCGPPGFVHAVYLLLVAANVPEKSIILLE